MPLPTITVTPSAAAQAYGRIDAGDDLDAASGGADFGAVLGRTLRDAVDQGHAADAKSMQAIAGHADVTDVVTAVSKAELTLQTTVAIRDRVVAAYQDIMRMPI